MGLGLPFIVSREFSAEDIVSCDTIMVAAGNVSSLENDKVCKSSGHLTVSLPRSIAKNGAAGGIHFLALT